MSKEEGKKIAVKFTQLLVGDVTGNESAFKVTGQEYQYIDGPDNNGPLVNKNYAVTSVSNHPTEPNSILLEFTNGFRNVKGNISISYNQALGTLAGTGGAVESFTKIFKPTDLVAGVTGLGIAVGTHEHIEASIGGIMSFVSIISFNKFHIEYIESSIGGIIQLFHIEDINP